jgi:cysteinyl-tRNA synthetase
MRWSLCRRLVRSRSVLGACLSGNCGEVKVSSSLVDSTGAHLVNSLTPGKPLTWYSCGPTVYDASHLGHARTYVSTDVIRRIMSDYHNTPVSYAMGITDVDDKIINKAVQQKYTTWQEVQTMVRQLENDFFRDMDRLHVLRPDHVLRVSEHMPAILDYTRKLVHTGHAYVTGDGVYFDYSSLSNEYDKFGCANIPDVEPTPSGNGEPTNGDSHFVNSAEIHQKRNAKDFALWKLHSTSSDSGRFSWDSPWGAGRPGWHIECSAMTHSLFGKHLDIHSGGVDLKFPHHTNEIAQWYGLDMFLAVSCFIQRALI